MACQCREFHAQLDDAEKLRLYAQSAVSKHQALDSSLPKAKSRSKHWEWEAKAGAEKIARAEKARNEAKKEAQVAWLVAVAAGEAKARVEDDLARVQEALAVAEKATRKAKAETSRLEVEKTSLFLELKLAKDEVSSLHSQAGKDKKAMDEDYQKALELIFAYGNGCCVFKHNICGDQPEVPDGMPDSYDSFLPNFFAKPRCPSTPVAIEVTIAEVDQDEVTKEPEKSAFSGNQS